MEWENKFSSIVKETENNLARVRDRLDSSKRVHYSIPSQEPSTLSSLTHSLDYNHQTSAMYPSRLKSSTPPSKSHRDSFSHSTSPQRNAGSVKQSSSSPAVLSILFERMEQQAEMLESLSSSVRQLEKDKNNQAKIITSLQEEVSQLNNRLREQGVDMETERKLDHFKREMYSHLERIQSQHRLQLNGSDSSYGDPSTATLARDLHENKRLLHEDCNSLRREIDHMKTRIAKMELETHSGMGDARDSNRRLDRLDRAVDTLSENQRSQSHSLTSMVDERELRTGDIGSLREKIDQLSRHVSDWESDPHELRKDRKLGSGSSSSNRRRPSAQVNERRSLMNGHSVNRKKTKRKLKENSHDMSDSDLDMSSAMLGLSSASDSELTSVRQPKKSSYFNVDVNEMSDLSSSLSSLNSDELLVYNPKKCY